MQKVFVVIMDLGCGDYEIEGIFSSEEKAKRFLEIEEEDNSYFNDEDYTIKEMIVDSACVKE